MPVPAGKLTGVDDTILIGPHVQAAQEAFWQVIAMRFPELTTGDVSPDATEAFDRACHDVVWEWLGSNLPPGGA